MLKITQRLPLKGEMWDPRPCSNQDRVNIRRILWTLNTQ